MGLEAECIARKGEQIGAGKAQLETDFLLFRGTFRFRIPLADVKHAQAESGRLMLSCGDGSVCLELGPVAAKWADKILHPPQRLDKLGVRPDHQVVILGMDDKEFYQEVAARTKRISPRIRKNANVVFLSAQNKADLLRLGTVQRSIQPDGAIWVIYPKGVSIITEEDVRRAGKEEGLVDVKVASFSSTHTALKFVIPAARRHEARK